MTTIIGILGPAGSGKSTVGNYLVQHYGAKRYSFASPIKEIARLTFGFTDEQLYGSQEQKEAIDPRYGFSPRWFFQRFGTEAAQTVFGPDVWIDTTINQIKREKPRVAVIDDVRFIREAKALVELGLYHNELDAYVWRLEPPERHTNADPTHRSEAEWVYCPFNMVIKPSKMDLDELYARVEVATSCLCLEKL